MTTVRKASWRATTAQRWRRCSSTSRAAAPTGPRHERIDVAWRDFVQPRQCDDPALLVSLAVVLAAVVGADLLAGAAGDHLGLPADLYRAECQFFCTRRRHADRRRDPVGHPVPRAAR